MASETTGNEQQDEILDKSKSKGLNTGTKSKPSEIYEDRRTSGEVLADQIVANRAANQYTGAVWSADTSNWCDELYGWYVNKQHG